MSGQSSKGVFAWRSLKDLERKLTRHLEIFFPDEINSLFLTQKGTRVSISGLVHSEAVRSAALRTLAASLDDFEIEDQLVVVGIFQPAADDDWFLNPPEAFEDIDSVSRDNPDTETDTNNKAQAVRRHPVIFSEDSLKPGTQVNIIVDLATEPRFEATEALTLAHLPPGWEQITVDVTVNSSAFSEGVSGKGQVVVREDGGSTPASVSVRLSEEILVGTDVEVVVLFNHSGRFCGHQSEIIGQVVAAREKDKNRDRSAGSITIAPNAPPPTMTVTVIKIDETLHWSWNLAPGAPSPPTRSAGACKLNAEPSLFASKLMNRCPETAPENVKRRMGAIGEQIWAATPTEFKETYIHIRGVIGAVFPIQFILNDFHIPWEMMRPPDGEHIFLTHPVARWTVERGDQPPVLPSGRKISFVPDYKNDATLPAAKEEQAWLESELGADVITPLKREFLKRMDAGEDVPTISLIHFAGHGKAASSASDASLEMQDAEVLIGDVDVSDTKLGDRDRSLVVLNACEAAAVSDNLSWVEGWAPTMAKRGFGAVIAPMWRVQDQFACDVVKSGLDNFYRNQNSLGEAFTKARADVAKSSVAAFAFLTYGDVMARLGD